MPRRQMSGAQVVICLFLGLATAGALILHVVRNVPSETQSRLLEIQNENATLKDECAQMRQFLQSPLCTKKTS